MEKPSTLTRRIVGSIQLACCCIFLIAATTTFAQVQLPLNVTCRPTITINCDDSPFDSDLVGEPVISGGCEPAAITNIDITDVPYGCGLQLSKTFTVVDPCGNVASCTQTIYMLDLTPPEISCPDNTGVPFYNNTNPGEIAGRASAPSQWLQ